MTQRLGTFEEWYQKEMKARDSKRTWHYPTELVFEYDYKNGTANGLRPIYRKRRTTYKDKFVPITKWDKVFTPKKRKRKNRKK